MQLTYFRWFCLFLLKLQSFSIVLIALNNCCIISLYSSGCFELGLHSLFYRLACFWLRFAFLSIVVSLFFSLALEVSPRCWLRAEVHGLQLERKRSDARRLGKLSITLSGWQLTQIRKSWLHLSQILSKPSCTERRHGFYFQISFRSGWK